MTPGVASYLVEILGKNINALSLEIEKLCNFKLRGDISVGDVDQLVTRQTDLNIFHLIDAIVAKNKIKAIELLYKELSSGRDPHYILSMVIYQFRNLLMVQDLSLRGLSSQLIVKKTGLHPFVVKKTIYNSQKFEREEAIILYNNLAEMDIAFKNGLKNIDDFLYDFILN